jgi:ribosomal protein S18 acetylase RimI-like enzyme
MNIIRAKTEYIPDIVFLNSFVQKIHHEEYPDIFKPPGNNDALGDYFERVLENPSNCVLIAYEEDQPMGYLCATFVTRSENALTYERRQVYIQHVAVHEDFRRRNVGSTLFDKLESMANQKGFNNFALDTWVFNTNAQNFFESLGFEPYNIKSWRMGDIANMNRKI